MKLKHSGLLLLLVALAAASTSAQTAIPVGSGSYASFPPTSAGATAQGCATQSLYVAASNTQPVPSNHWWTDLLVHQYGGNLWAHPLSVSTDAQGINICKPDFNTVYDGSHSFLGANFQPDFPLRLHGQSFAPADARVLNWGDWTVSFRMQQSVSQFMDVTFGHGLPYVWVQFTGVAPQIVSDEAATYFRDDGSPQNFPATTDHVGIAYGGRYYGIFAPDNTTFTLTGNTLAVSFASSTNTYLVVGAFPAQSNLAYFAQHAYAVPTNSTMNWIYNPATAAVTTLWHLATQPWKGTETNTIQGWIPHHWRNAHNFAYNGIEYGSARGLMKCATGTDFQITYKFNGIPPSLPPPAVLGKPNDYDPAVMNGFISSVAANPAVTAETYGGGIDLLRLGQHLVFANLLGRPETNTLATALRNALSDWFTYNPAGDGKYFAYYPAWKALTGFPASYGSDQFNDHHFHYGYFAHAAALLCMYDPMFKTNYGPMAKLVAKEYANWDRSDTNFPFLRTFDIWEGHSWASGLSDSTKGNNQESSSEAMNSWGGLFLLGAVMGDDQMRAAGAMGWAMEAESVRQYYFNAPKFYNASDSNWPPNYTKTVVGILWGSGQEGQTYFGADSLYTHGIQWLPPSPIMSYQVEDPDFARQDFNNMLAERGNNFPTDAKWGVLALSYEAQFDPDSAAAQWDSVSHDYTYSGVAYWQIHSTRKMGRIQWQFHMDTPLSTIYYNTNSAQYTYVAYNPKNTPQVATVYSNQVAIGSLVLPAFTLVNTNILIGNDGTIPLTVIATSPLANQTGVSPDLTQISVTFNQNVSAASLATATMTGPNVTGLTYSQGDGTPQVVFNINGSLQSSQTYTVAIPGSATVAGGTNTLGNDYAYSFTTAAPPPPLAVIATSPTSNQTGVSPDLSQISVTFNQNVSAASLATATMTGANVTGLTYSQGDGTPQVIFNINGSVQPLQTYTATIPAAATVASGTNTLGSDYVFNFTTAAEVPPSPNPVLNPSFEKAGASPSLATNWIVSQAAGGPVYAVRTNDNPRTGTFNFEVHLASTGAGPVVEFSQSGVPVTGGSIYPFTFSANAMAGSSGYNAQWRILWNAGGDTGFQGFTPGNNTYASISNSVTAPAAATAATIFFHLAGAADLNQSATIGFDDISLSDTTTNSGGGLTTNVVAAIVERGVAIIWPTLAQSNYVVQGVADLTTPDGWTNLSATITGDGTTNSLFDPIGSNPRKFYRVLQSP